MNKVFRSILSCLLALILLCSSTITVFAHSGRTDSSGGHKDNKNKSGLGSYHYHCGGYPAHLHDGGYCPYTDVFPQGVSFNIGSKTLRKGETTTFTAEVYPANSCNTRISLSCKESDVIRISGNTITAVGYGTATIVAETFNGRISTIQIVVKEVVANSVTVSSTIDDSQPVYIGDSLQCSAAISPEDVDNPAITWSSSDTNIATVDKNGNIKTLAEGSVTISATASNGVVGKKTIHVKEKHVEKVELPDAEMQVLLGSTHSLSATVTPADATYPELKWLSSDKSIIEVDENGEIHALSCGSATIIATAKNGKSAQTKIEVTEIVAERIEITYDSPFIINEDNNLIAEIYPHDTTIKDIEWSTSDPQIATVDETGKVNCLSIGFVTITATQKDVVASIDVEVSIRPVERIEIQCSKELENKLRVGESITLSASVYPENATHQEIEWISSAPEIATVDKFGTVTTHTDGEAIITARTQDGCVQEYALSVSHTISSFFEKVFSKLFSS